MPTRKMPQPYAIADRTQKSLNRQILKRTEQTRRKLSVLDFDELNVLKETDVLYEQIGTACQRELKALYGARYMEVWLWLKGELPKRDDVDELVEMYFAGLWDVPNESTHYAFGPELDRKRDRAKEAIVAVPTKTQKQLELEKASRYVIQQAAFYVDITSQDAEKQAMVNAGVKKVKWNIYGDDRVCKTCHDRNGKIYEITKVPPRPHLRCRCYLTPVTE